MNEEPEDSLDFIVNRTVAYYEALRGRNIPEDLAVRIVGDWYHLVTTNAAAYIEGRFRMSEKLTNRQIEKILGRSNAHP